MNAPVRDLSIRASKPEDHAAIRALLTDVFGRRDEADLVDRLRAEHDLALELVAVGSGAGVPGYVAFPRLWIESRDGRTPAVGLAPLAVAAEHRRQGIGGMLVRIGLQFLKRRDEAIVFVVGDPAYYRKFDFFTDAARGFACAYAGANFLALAFKPDGPRRGTVVYPKAFAGL
jgi:putative acetyltransferase